MVNPLIKNSGEDPETLPTLMVNPLDKEFWGGLGKKKKKSEEVRAPGFPSLWG